MVSATISVALYLTTRWQSKRDLVLDLFKEYYSEPFALRRREATAFMDKHKAVDWTSSDPYIVGAKDPNLEGYSSVVRFWQRAAILYRESELDRGLAQNLLARELGTWSRLLFKPMSVRSNMYVGDLVGQLMTAFRDGGGRTSFEAGELAP